MLGPVSKSHEFVNFAFEKLQLAASKWPMASPPSGSNTQRRAQGQQAQRLHPGRDVTGPWWRCPDAPEQGRVRFKGAFTKKISGKETNTNTKNYQSWSEIIKTSRKQIWAFDDGWSPRMTRLLVDLGSYWDKESVAVCWGTKISSCYNSSKTFSQRLALRLFEWSS